jgi:hypothetical protein
MKHTTTPRRTKRKNQDRFEYVKLNGILLFPVILFSFFLMISVAVCFPFGTPTNEIMSRIELMKSIDENQAMVINYDFPDVAETIEIAQ